MSRIKLARRLKKIDDNIQNVFVTTYEQYALKAFTEGRLSAKNAKGRNPDMYHSGAFRIGQWEKRDDRAEQIGGVTCTFD